MVQRYSKSGCRATYDIGKVPQPPDTKQRSCNNSPPPIVHMLHWVISCLPSSRQHGGNAGAASCVQAHLTEICAHILPNLNLPEWAIQNQSGINDCTPMAYVTLRNGFKPMLKQTLWT